MATSLLAKTFKLRLLSLHYFSHYFFSLYPFSNLIFCNRPRMARSSLSPFASILSLNWTTSVMVVSSIMSFVVFSSLNRKFQREKLTARSWWWRGDEILGFVLLQSCFCDEMRRNKHHYLLSCLLLRINCDAFMNGVWELLIEKRCSFWHLLLGSGPPQEAKKPTTFAFSSFSWLP